MNLVVLDIASVIWDKQQFEKDATAYYQLADEISVFFDAFEKVDLNLLIRQNLLDEILLSFPFELTSNKAYFKEFRTVAFSFLSRITDLIEYDKKSDNIITIPSILHDYYSSTTKLECHYLIHAMHSTSRNVIFCTFSAIWNNGNLQSNDNNNVKEYDTIIHPNNSLVSYIKSISKKFEHNPKHDRVKGRRLENGVWIFPLSCFDGIDTTVPQKLLDNAVQYGNEFYNYDTTNQTFICFRKHQDNKYHGYDEDINNVPQKIRRNFKNE